LDFKKVLMQYQKNIFSINRSLVSVLLFTFLGINLFAQETTTLIAISNTKGAPSQMKMSELKSVLKGERQRWSDGTKVSIYLMKTITPLGNTTCQKIYNMSGDKVRRFWLELSFSGKADAPTFCNSVEELESLVSQNPGSIGIIDKSTTSSSAKTVMIDGKNSF
jgi:hypothetical protein